MEIWESRFLPRRKTCTSRIAHERSRERTRPLQQRKQFRRSPQIQFRPDMEIIDGSRESIDRVNNAAHTLEETGKAQVLHSVVRPHGCRRKAIHLGGQDRARLNPLSVVPSGQS
jgi:hypothetical protein